MTVLEPVAYHYFAYKVFREDGEEIAVCVQAVEAAMSLRKTWHKLEPKVLTCTAHRRKAANRLQAAKWAAALPHLTPTW